MHSSLVARPLGGWFYAIALLAVALPAGLADAQTPVKVGYLREPFNINVVKLADFVDGKRVAIELVPFRQFAEVGRALQAGEIQVAAFGYQNAGIFLDAGFTDFTLLAGISSGGQSITQGRAWRSRARATSPGRRSACRPIASWSSGSKPRSRRRA